MLFGAIGQFWTLQTSCPRLQAQRHEEGGNDVEICDREADMVEACRAASPGPWKAFVEGRDHWAGDDFIRVSDLDEEPDMYVSRADVGEVRPASVVDLDFIAAARQDIPALLAEVRRLRSTAG